MNFEKKPLRLLSGWALIVAIFVGLGYVRFQLRDLPMQSKRWVGALGNVTQCEEVSGGYRHKFSYRPPGRQLVEHNDVLAQPHERGESLPIEYLESEPKLYRQLGQPANWVEVVGRGWCLALLVGGSACMIFYAWWLHKQT